MGLQDVAFLPSQASSSTTFCKHCGRGEGLGATTCHIAVVGGNQWHAPCMILSLRHSLFLSQLNFMEITRLTQIWSPSVLGILPDVKQWCLSL